MALLKWHNIKVTNVSKNCMSPADLCASMSCTQSINNCQEGTGTCNPATGACSFNALARGMSCTKNSRPGRCTAGTNPTCGECCCLRLHCILLLYVPALHDRTLLSLSALLPAFMPVPNLPVLLCSNLQKQEVTGYHNRDLLYQRSTVHPVVSLLHI